MVSGDPQGGRSFALRLRVDTRQLSNQVHCLVSAGDSQVTAIDDTTLSLRPAFGISCWRRPTPGSWLWRAKIDTTESVRGGNWLASQSGVRFGE